MATRKKPKDNGPRRRVSVGDYVRMVGIKPYIYGTIVEDLGDIGYHGRQLLRIRKLGIECDIPAEECVVVRKYA